MKSNTAVATTEEKADTVTRTSLASEISQLSELSNKEALAAIDSMFSAIRDALAKGEPVKISRFGRWEVRDKAARQGRNPQTGEKLVIAARKVLKFHASDVLKKSLND